MCNATVRSSIRSRSHPAWSLLLFSGFLRVFKTSMSETKDFVNQLAALHRLDVALFRFPGFRFPPATVCRIRENMRWDALQNRSSSSGTLNHYMDSKHDCPFFQRNTLPVSAKAICYTEVLQMGQWVYVCVWGGRGCQVISDF